MFFVNFCGGCEYINVFDDRLETLVSNLLVQNQSDYLRVNLQF